MTVGLVKQSLKLFSFLLIVGQMNASMWVRITGKSTQDGNGQITKLSRDFIVWEGSEKTKNAIKSSHGFELTLNDPRKNPIRGIFILNLENGSLQTSYYELSDRYWSFEDIKAEDQFEYSIGSMNQCNWCDPTYRDNHSTVYASFGSKCIGTFDEFFGITSASSVEKTIITVVCNIDPKTDLVDVKKFKEQLSANSEDIKLIVSKKLDSYLTMENLSYSLITEKEGYSEFVEHAELMKEKNKLSIFKPNFYFPLVQYKDQPSDTNYKFSLIKGSSSKGPLATGIVTFVDNSIWGFLIGFQSSSGSYKVIEGGFGDVQMKNSDGTGDYVSIVKARNVEDVEVKNVDMKGKKGKKQTVLVSLKIPGDSENFFRSTGSGEGKKWNQFLNDPNSDWELKRKLIIV